MDVSAIEDQPCYSVRLLKPFLAAVEQQVQLPASTLRWFAALDPDERVHVAAVHTMLRGALALTNDELLGVRASKLSTLGDVGLLDYVMSSADTLRSALEAAGRYTRLLNDTLSFALELEGEHVIVRLTSRVVLPAVAEDYQTCGMISNQSVCWPEGLLENMDVWFRHGPPAQIAPYHEALGPVRLHFHAPLSGFGFPRRFLDLPLRSSDPKLHEVLRRYAEIAVASLPKPQSTTERVRALVSGELSSGAHSLDETARALHMSARTLGRRLAEEGTTFKRLIDELRKELALRYVATRDIDLAQIAQLSGFSETPSFCRAFRRWTGTTPKRYRRSHRGDARALRA
jgi:AraC-like DNA-binding protein